MNVTSISGALGMSIVIGVSLAACDAGSDEARDAGASDAGPIARDSGPPRDAGPPCVFALPIDILFVVDDSHSMAEEQANLTRNFPVLFDALTSPPDADGDGEPDHLPADDVRLGVISTDLGVGAHGVVGCDASGASAALIDAHRGIDPACADVMLSPDPWVEYREGDDPEEIARRFSCVARLGTGGCGLEQQLEAALQAVTTRAAPGEPNEGFVRPGSLVAIVFVTDEDDCSAADDSIFDPTREAELGSYGRRCAEHPELLHPISRYVDGFAALRFDRTNDVIVAAITGVPFGEAGADPLAVDYDAVLADERMQFRPDPARMEQLAPACETGGTGSAVPARRIVEVVRAFAETGDGLATTICDDDLSPALRSIGALIARRICLPPI
ncbi:MAG: hypothetical protein M3Y87_06270 [Myxococcota bacterium]|nr:hypothetical protein [Myxococcota bacterium]